MKARVTSEKSYTWQQVKEIMAAGQAREIFGDDGEITVLVGGIGEVIMNILDYDKDKAAADPDAHTMTVQCKDLVFSPMQFDEDGSNKWENSSLRAYLNSQEFLEKFEEGFRDLIVQVEKENDGREKTLDTFFLLSVEEMKDDKKKYQRFRSERDCVKVDPEKETDWHWTRSAYRGYANNTWSVSASGDVNAYYAAASSSRFAPACVIAAI